MKCPGNPKLPTPKAKLKGELCPKTYHNCPLSTLLNAELFVMCILCVQAYDKPNEVSYIRPPFLLIF